MMSDTNVQTRIFFDALLCFASVQTQWQNVGLGARRLERKAWAAVPPLCVTFRIKTFVAVCLD
jgi:hypothetical protein